MPLNIKTASEELQVTLSQGSTGEGVEMELNMKGIRATRNGSSETHRILFIMPPFYRLHKNSYSGFGYPLSLGYLAGTVVKETEWKARIFNADFSPEFENYSVQYMTGPGFKRYIHTLQDLSSPIWDEVRSAIHEFIPGAVGIYSTTQQFASARVVAQLAKEWDPAVNVIIGGPHPTLTGEDVFEDPSIDIAVRGEGERTMVDLLGALGTGRNLDSVKGILFRQGNQIIRTQDREQIQDLDSLCFPHKYAKDVLKDFNKLPIYHYHRIFATRGCPYNCFFCGSRYIWGRKVRFRSPDNVAEEIQELQMLGLHHIHFDDDTFGVNSRYIRAVCNAIKTRCPGITWSCEMHVKLVNEENIALMKGAGCIRIQLGLESGNDEMLRKIRKGITTEEAKAAIHIIQKHGIKLTAFFIIGFPEETEDTLQDTFALMKSIPGFLVFNIFTPYPGSEAFEFCTQQGLIGKDFDVALYNHQSPENCFCLHISRERFRELAKEIGAYVDRHNRRESIRTLFSMDHFHRIRDEGFSPSVRHFLKILER